MTILIVDLLFLEYMAILSVFLRSIDFAGSFRCFWLYYVRVARKK